MNTTKTKIKQIEKQIAKLQKELDKYKAGKAREYKVFWYETTWGENFRHTATVTAKNEKDAAVQFEKNGLNIAMEPDGQGGGYCRVPYAITKIKAI